MTTLAEDSQSYKAGSVIRRDFRSARDEIQPKTHKSKKDTKRWCKGVVGREHVIEVKSAWPRSSWMADFCVTCGKRLRFHEHPPTWGIF